MQSASRKQSLIDRSVLPRHLCTVSIDMRACVRMDSVQDMRFVIAYRADRLAGACRLHQWMLMGMMTECICELQLYVYVDLHVDVYVDIYVDVYVDVYVDIYVDVYVDVYVDIYVDVYVDVYVDICGCICI